jgi:tetratricopeptide (TPR) repeat protein
MMALWDSPRQRETFDWFATELANLRTAFRWAADQGDLDTAAAIATQAGLFGVLVENYEPITWAEELIEPARALDHPRLVSLYAIASLCYMLGRVDDALGFSDAGQLAMRRSPDIAPFGVEVWLGAVYSAIGEPERWVAFFRDLLARGRDTHELARACLVVALTNAGRPEEALSVATGLIDAAEATHNPYVVSFALLAYGMACSAEDPLRALDALRRGVAIAQQSGNLANETYLAMTLAMTLGRIEGESGDPLIALENITLAIRNYHDSGQITQIRAALGILATFLDRHGHNESAAIIAGFACVGPTSAPLVKEFGTAVAHLRDLLGDQAYESLVHKGEAMTVAAVVAYAYDQIAQARRELDQPD